MKRILLIAITIVATAILGLVIFSLEPVTKYIETRAARTPANPAVISSTRTIPPVIAGEQTSAKCQVKPFRTASLAFTTSGLVSGIQVVEGEAVKAGQSLATLATRSQAAAALASAEQELVASQQALKSLQDGAFLALAQARKDLNDSLVAIKSAKKALDKAKDDQESDEIIAQADANLELARTRQVELQKRYDLLKAGPDPEKIALAQKRLENAQAQVTAARDNLAGAELSAPFSGTVALVGLKAGDFALAGTPVIQVGDASRWMAETVDLTELNIVHVKVGSAATIVVDALPEIQFTGTVTTISPYGQNRQGEIVYPVQVVFSADGAPLRWNMTCGVSIQK